jgi:hypothetical protein
MEGPMSLHLTKDELLSDFRKSFDVLAFPQPLVAKVIGATQKDLNTWRGRGQVRIGAEGEGRIRYTGRGLIHAGIVNELAHFVDPTRAAAFSDDLINHVSQFGANATGKWVIFFNRPYDADGSPAGEGRELVMSMLPADAAENTSRHHAQMTLPIGDLMEGWAIMAQMMTAHGQAA